MLTSSPVSQHKPAAKCIRKAQPMIVLPSHFSHKHRHVLLQRKRRVPAPIRLLAVGGKQARTPDANIGRNNVLTMCFYISYDYNILAKINMLYD